jgi:sugar-specific transcriptional regulator TrmB
MQNTPFIDAFISVGLSKTDAELYLLLVNNNQISVTEVAKKLSIHRARVYDAFKNLESLQLIQRENDYSKVTEVEAPTRVLALLDEKQSQLKLQKEKLEEVIPEIMYQYGKNQKYPRIAVFEGLGQMSKIQFQHINEVENETLWLNLGQEISNLFDENFFYFSSPQKRSAKGVSTRILANSNNITMKKYHHLDLQHLREVRYLPPDYHSQSTITIYNSKIILWNTYIPRAIIIYDQQLAQSHKDMFELLWRGFCDTKV